MTVGLRVIGMISGTSMDGIDAAVAELSIVDDVVTLRPIGATSVPYAPDLRSGMAAALPPATTSAGELCRLDSLVGRAFAEAARTVLGELAGGRADLIASHGQTLFHWVDEGGRARGTLQIGQPAWIAAATGLPVVADLRAADVAAGGQGAPLAALFDQLLLAGTPGTTAALNLGGIANMTIVSADLGGAQEPRRQPVSYDIGPANALIDAAVRHVTGGAHDFDRDGAMARRGMVQRDLLRRLLDDPYYRRQPPKSTGKEHFHAGYLLERVGDDAIGADDLVATVTALTAVTVAADCRAAGVERLLVSGGGASNPVLFDLLTAELPDVRLSTIDELGVPADAKEAYLLALIGFLSVHHLPGNAPWATGADRPVVLGSVVPGASGFPDLRRHPTTPTRLVVQRDHASPR
jgi:anhydro-N-acetylmuramic acid kinase